MPTHQAANGAITSQQQLSSSRAHITNGSHALPPLLRLPTDVWLHIFAQLQPRSASTLTALSTTCKHVLRLVDEHGWKGVLAQEYAGVRLDRLDAPYKAYVRHLSRSAIVRSRWWFACRYACLLKKCWADVTLRTGSVDIPAAERKKPPGPARSRRFGSDFAIPTLTVGTRWILVGARSELFVYNATAPQQLISRIKLNSRPGETATAPDDPWQDITALEAFDAAASSVVVGYADGCVQLIALRSKGGGVEAEVLRHFAASRRHEVASVSVQSSDASSSNDVASEEVLIASLSKRGLLRIHAVDDHVTPNGDGKEWSWQIDSEGTAVIPDPNVAAADDSGASTPRTFRSAAFNNAPADTTSSASGTRAWSVLLGSCADARKPARGADRWVAVGITAEHAVYIYPLSRPDGSVQLGEPFHVASKGQRTSVYAMATPPASSSIPSFLLFVGFYDGVVRVYDTRQLYPASPANGPRRRRRELDPIALFRADYDTDAVYSLSFGGPRAELLVIGGSRHAKARVFDVSALAAYDVPLLSAPGAQAERRDWTAFALHSTDSPLYGVVGAADRLVGVTDRRLWWFDFGAPLLDRGDGESVAFFRHADGELRYSSPRHTA
ncbi:uncharacterized protein SRS1_15875 [Sporisorium reilianum f. sp. reilianum]|uniref:F-box domain-containing protein n=1 Tax=Sporisorium reilianum f. sp. reilianum TaxID=72559 RepID=A0A2N8UJV0_9BASI|nr:uncharacterized protein SRS1_15875 [Sporisorium reilianum f. sp. reilianum]